MRIVMVHYHLRAGGVTRVMEREIKSLLELDPKLEIILVSGTVPDIKFAGFDSVTIDVVPEMQYWSYHEAPEKSAEIQQAVSQALEKYYTDDTVFHFHNHALGKNPAVTYACYKLIQKGARAFLHCHDFAEDRPLLYKEIESYFTELSLVKDLLKYLYPQSINVQYATINSSDLMRPVLCDRKPEVLNNPVIASYISSQSRELVASQLSIDINDTWVLYPVRCIGRKNIAEIIYLSLIMGNEVQWLLSLPPENPFEVIYYNKWVKLAKELGVKVMFEVAKKVSFDNLMAETDMIVTTSVREGFGMAYLEPLLLKKPLFGRRLPVVDDFEALGILQPHLYGKLLVRYNNEKVDFGTLDDGAKEVVIREGADALVEKSSLQSLFKTALLQSDFDKEIALIQRYYAPEQHAQELMNTYTKLLA